MYQNAPVRNHKKNPCALYSTRVCVCGSNRTRTYDTPGMKRDVVQCTTVDLLGLYVVPIHSDNRSDNESAFLSTFFMSSRISFLMYPWTFSFPFKCSMISASVLLFNFKCTCVVFAASYFRTAFFSASVAISFHPLQCHTNFLPQFGQ